MWLELYVFKWRQTGGVKNKFFIWTQKKWVFVLSIFRKLKEKCVALKDIFPFILKVNYLSVLDLYNTVQCIILFYKREQAISWKKEQQTFLFELKRRLHLKIYKNKHIQINFKIFNKSFWFLTEIFVIDVCSFSFCLHPLAVKLANIF